MSHFIFFVAANLAIGHSIPISFPLLANVRNSLTFDAGYLIPSDLPASFLVDFPVLRNASSVSLTGTFNRFSYLDRISYCQLTSPKSLYASSDLCGNWQY